MYLLRGTLFIIHVHMLLVAHNVAEMRSKKLLFQLSLPSS